MSNLFDPVLPGIVRILDRQQHVVGTGFVIFLFPQTFAWIMTSSQVVELATGIERSELLGQTEQEQEQAHVSIVFHIDPTEKQWNATIINWLGSERENICVLRVDGDIPDRVRKLPLIQATHAEGRNVSIFGYPEEHPTLHGAWRYSQICRPGPKHIATKQVVLQIETREMTNSYRGAPVWDDIRRRVLGIVVGIERQGKGELQLENTYAVPAEVIEKFHKDTFRANEVPVETTSPYHSNEPFTEDDASSFHGYETVIDKLLELLDDGNRKLLVMLGPEKSGKTSVVQAGLIPRLKNTNTDDHPDWSIFKTYLSSDDPLKELEQQGLAGASDNLVRSLHIWQQKHGSSKMVLILDHFESILLNCSLEKQQHFVQHLLQSVDEQAASILLVVRDEFYSLLAKHEKLILQAEENFINVFSPQKKEELINMVRQREDIPEVLLKPELLEQIYDKATASVSAHRNKHSSTVAKFESLLEQVYLQHQQLSLDKDDMDIDVMKLNLNTLSIHTGDWAEQIYLSLEKEEHVVQHLLTQMILLGEDGIPDTKYYRPIEDLCAGNTDKYDLLTKLVDKGLLVTNRDRSTGKETITLAQDTLLHEWTRMRGWLDEKRRFLFWRKDFQPKLQNWQAASTNVHTNNEDMPNYLLQDVSLTESIQWSDLYAHSLDPEEIHFIQTSRSYQQKKETKQLIELRNAISRDIKQKQEEEDKRREICLASQLVTQAKAVYEKSPQLLPQSVLLAATSLSLAPSPEADQILRLGLAFLPRVERDIPINANIFAADFSQDGHYVAVVYDQDVEIKDLSTDEDGFFFHHETKVVALVFSSDAEYLITADDTGNVWAWYLYDQTSRCLYQKASVISMTLSPGGRYVAVCHWDTDTSTLVILESTQWHWAYKETYHPVYEEICEEQIHSIVFSADDNIFAVGYIDGVVKMYNFSYKKFFFNYSDEKRMSLVAISSSAHYVAIAYDDGEVVLYRLHVPGTEALYNYDTETTLKKISSQTYAGRIRKMLFSPSSSYLIIASNDATVRVWKFSNEQHMEVHILLHNGPVYRLALSQDGLYLATASEDQLVRVWDMHTSQEIARFKHGQYVENLAFSRERHYLFTAGDDRAVRVWGMIKSQQCLPFPQDLPVHALVWRPHLLELAVCDEDGHIKIWRLERGYDLQIRLQLADTHPIQSFAYSPDGRYIVTKSSTSILVWDAESGEHRHIQSLKNAHSYCLAFSADSTKFAIGCGNCVTLWETIRGQLKTSYEYDEQICSIVFHTSNKSLAIGFEHGTVKIWHWQRVNDQSTLLALPNGSIHTPVFSPDGHRLAAASVDGVAYVWEWETEKDQTRIEIPHGTGTKTICFSPNGQLIAIISADHHVHICDAINGLVLLQLESVRDLVFNPDGLYLATTGDGNKVDIRHTTTGNKIVSLPHDDTVTSIAFSSDGKFLATGSKDGIVKSWLWHPEDLIRDVCCRVTHNLTQEEWQKYIGKNEAYYKLNSSLL